MWHTVEKKNAKYGLQRNPNYKRTFFRWRLTAILDLVVNIQFDFHSHSHLLCILPFEFVRLLMPKHSHHMKYFRMNAKRNSYHSSFDRCRGTNVFGRPQIKQQMHWKTDILVRRIICSIVNKRHKPNQMNMSTGCHIQCRFVEPPQFQVKWFPFFISNRINCLIAKRETIQLIALRAAPFAGWDILLSSILSCRLLKIIRFMGSNRFHRIINFQVATTIKKLMLSSEWKSRKKKLLHCWTVFTTNNYCLNGICIATKQTEAILADAKMETIDKTEPNPKSISSMCVCAMKKKADFDLN